MPLFWLSEGVASRYAPESLEAAPAGGGPGSFPAGLSQLQKAYSQLHQEPVRHPATVAEEIMTRAVVTVPRGLAMHDAHRLMLERRFRHLPVVDEREALVGLVSDRDILRARSGRSPEDLPIDRLTNPHVLTASPDTDLPLCVRTMLSHRISCIPILSGPLREVAGILTTEDLLRALVRDAPIDVLL